MLSILIPVYNFDIRFLVKNLQAQCCRAKIKYEILCFDDGSLPEFIDVNREVSELQGVVFEMMPHNMGRSAIRNQLGKAAKYPYLLFMDNDSALKDANYIDNYIQKLSPDALVYGGRIYDHEKPKNKSLLLHWEYGRKREVSVANERAKNEHHSFMTNNFVIPKKIFLNILFDEKLKNYGHEDTLFGLELKKIKIPIIHIDNPLIHIGLEESAVFLKKSCQALDNLLLLLERHPMEEVRILWYYKWVKKLGLSFILRRYYNQNKEKIERDFNEGRINLRRFDLYKLSYLLIASKMKK